MAPRTQKRGRETHERIVEAAVRLLARHGAPGVTHRSVAEEAGVSLALTTYHFESKDEILEQVYARLTDDEIRRFRETYQPPGPDERPEEILDYIATQVIREATEFREASIAGCELMLEACRSPELSASILRVFDEKMAFWRKTLDAMGSPSPSVDAQIAFCTTLGHFITMMARGRSASELARTRSKLQYDIQSLVRDRT